MEYKKDDFDFSTFNISEWLAKNCSFASYEVDRRKNHCQELDKIPLARPQVEGVARAIARQYWKTFQNEAGQLLAAEGDQDLVVQSAHDAAFVRQVFKRLEPNVVQGDGHAGLLQLTSHHDPEGPLPATPSHHPSYEAESIQRLPHVLQFRAVVELVADRAFSAVAKQSLQLFIKEV